MMTSKQAISGVLNRLLNYFDGETVRELKKSQSNHELCDMLMKAAELKNHSYDVDYALMAYESLPPQEHVVDKTPDPCTALVATGQGRVTVEAVGILECTRPTVNRTAARELLAVWEPEYIPSGPVILLGDGLTIDQKERTMLEERLEWIASLFEKPQFSRDQWGNYIVVKQGKDWKGNPVTTTHSVRPENVERHLTLYQSNGWVIA